MDIHKTIEKLNEDAKSDYNVSLLFDESDVSEKRIKEKLKTKAEEKWQIARWLMELADIKRTEFNYGIAQRLYEEIEEKFTYNLKGFHWEMSKDVFDSLTGKFESNENENVTLFGLEIWDVKGKDRICLKLS